MRTATPITSTIFEQLGGNKFVAMTGAKLRYYEKEKELVVFFKGRRKIDALSIILEPTDLYTMVFTKNGILARRFENVSCDMLQDIFTDVTGLATHL